VTAVKNRDNTMKKTFFNVQIHAFTREDVFNKCDTFLQNKRPHTLYFLNAHCFNIAQKNPHYYKALEEADLLLNDGIGLKIASYFSKVRFKENLNGTDLIPQILTFAAQKGKSIYFLGSKPGIAEKAAQVAREKTKQLKIAGFSSGYFNKSDEPKIIESINTSGADILVLGMGVPRQELWAHENKKQFTNVKLIIAGGAILDFISGEVSRAPKWMRKAGMEWIYRLLLEPKRMWKRYVAGNFIFFYHVLALALKQR